MAAISMKRTILVILSNRFNRSQKPRHIELDSDDKGTILEERPLKRAPRKPVYDEVWENDEGKSDLSSSRSLKRKYRHPLEKPRP